MCSAGNNARILFVSISAILSRNGDHRNGYYNLGMHQIYPPSLKWRTLWVFIKCENVIDDDTQHPANDEWRDELWNVSNWELNMVILVIDHHDHITDFIFTTTSNQNSYGAWLWKHLPAFFYYFRHTHTHIQQQQQHQKTTEDRLNFLVFVRTVCVF